MSDIKYYMNNPCKIVREVNDNFVEVALYPLTDDITVTPDQFCMGCMIGGTVSHSCEEYHEVIDVINEDRLDKSIITIVEKKYLQEEPVEFKEYKKIRDKLRDAYREAGQLRNKTYDLKRELRELEDDREHLVTLNENLIKDVNDLHKEKQSLNEEVVNLLQEKESAGKVILDDNYTVNISIDQLKWLYKASHILTALENGGVDNWEWYGESVNNYGDIDEHVSDSMNRLKVKIK